MKHSRTLSLALPSLVTAAVIAMVGIACRDGDDRGTTADSPAATGSETLPPDTAIAACAISSDSVGRLTRREFTGWAERVGYDEPADTLGQPHGSATANIRVHRARGMNRVTRAHLSDGCLIARVRSTTAIPSLGLGVGWTYVWADSTNPYTATMVPEDGGTSITQFQMALETSEPETGTVASPRYICSDCGQDWCVYPRNTLSTEPALFQPEGTGFRDATGGGTVTLAGRHLPLD